MKRDTFLLWLILSFMCTCGMNIFMNKNLIITKLTFFNIVIGDVIEVPEGGDLIASITGANNNDIISISAKSLGIFIVLILFKHIFNIFCK